MTVVCLGDSITAGYPYEKEASWVQLCAEDLNLNLINAGINNHTTGDMLARFNRDVTPHRPKAVIILGGTNDAWQGVPMEKTKENFKRMIDMVYAINAQSILGLIPPIIKDKVQACFQLKDVEQFNNRLIKIRDWLKVFSGDKKILLLDFYTPLCKNGTGRGDPALFVDGGHPNRRGYRLLAESIKADLQNIEK
ncbi:lysophospholipase L1-like esterase [Desulfohalotomaculum tongense]|uniref:SGNH/GDSL hydrolase family protein n=1 Tax=Desulforadius tongensis TaxID=1216062 RepID=UPI00195D10DA|nr:SGNH/GDSL hydrolase family protein [Desulforadius tongensis]MBM7855275.1 lysophospholipase L1-like esterase [Desulforadius tongensis]